MEYQYAEAYPLSGVEYVQADLSKTGSLDVAFKGVDVVFQTAAMYGAPSFSSIQGGEVTERTNVGGMRNILDSAKKAKVKQVIYTASADTVFTNKSPRPLVNVNETDPYGLGPEQRYADGPMAVGDHYARTKIIAERLILSENGKGGVKTMSLRPNGIIGPGEFSAVKTSSMAGYLLGMIFFYFDTEQKTDWTCVSNLAYAHLLGSYKLYMGAKNVAGEAFFITDDDKNSNNGAWQIFEPALRGIGVPVRAWLWIPSAGLVGGGHAQEVFCKWAWETLGIWAPPILTRKEGLKATTTHFFDNSKAKAALGEYNFMTTTQCNSYLEEEMTRRFNM